MKKIINPKATLFALGVVQPAIPSEVRGIFKTMLEHAGEIPSAKEYEEFLNQEMRLGRVMAFQWEDELLYSLTTNGHQYLSIELRRLRDKLRAYLLKDVFRRKVTVPRDDNSKELAGASPAVDASTAIKGREANNNFGPRRAGQSCYWPRIQEQFRTQTGPSKSSRGTFPPLISFCRSRASGSCGPRYGPRFSNWLSDVKCMPWLVGKASFADSQQSFSSLSEI